MAKLAAELEIDAWELMHPDTGANYHGSVG